MLKQFYFFILLLIRSSRRLEHPNSLKVLNSADYSVQNKIKNL